MSLVDWMTIWTPDRRLRVFVSSALAELADERHAVSRAISSLRLTPVMFESGARPYPPRDLYRAYLEQSDIFVGLYWERYGWVAPGMRVSGLQEEFELSRGMPRLLYVKVPAPRREPQLADLLASVERDGSESYRSFRTPQELGRLVRDDLATLLGERFGGGSVHVAPGRDVQRCRVEVCDALSLGVHRAIEVAPGPWHRPLNDLPEFVGRAHDRRLRAALEAGAVSGQFIVLVGSSSTGKTRSAVEAVRDRLPGWLLVHPRTPSSLTALIHDDQIAPQTVLWLNESQIYLEAEDTNPAAVLLSGLLTSVRPVVIIGTLWPDYWHAYMKPAEFGAPDPHRQSRQLLGAAVKIDVPDTFTGQDLEAARKLAGEDPRLAIALATQRNRGVIQVLAGGPDLIDRWASAPTAYGKAIITAAIDARRLGHLGSLPAALLKAAATAYLDGPQLASASAAWFDDALSYATEPVKGAIAPLTATARAAGQIDGYLLADYLDQHGRRSRHKDPVPDLLWEALAAHAQQPGDLNRLGSAASDRGRYRHACRLWAAACRRGDTSMAMTLRHHLARVGHRAQAAQAHLQAVTAGDGEGLALLAELQRRPGHEHAMEQALRAAAAAGHLDAAHHLAIYLHQRHRDSEAEVILRQAITAGDHSAGMLLSTLLSRSGREDEAEPELRTAASAGNLTAVRILAERLEKTGRPAEAIQLLRRAFAMNLPGTLTDLTRLLIASGQAQEAEHVLSQHQTSHAEAPRLLANLLRRTGRPAEAEQVMRRARTQATGAARPASATYAPPRGRTPHARTRERGSSNREPDPAPESPADKAPPQLPQSHRPAADPPPWKSRQEDTESYIRRQIDQGDPNATRHLAVWLAGTGKLTRGETMLRQEITAGDRTALNLLPMILRLAGRTEEASRTEIFGLNEDGTTSQPWKLGT
jgi:tetratricopeptide (TPR) repeat protein